MKRYALILLLASLSAAACSTDLADDPEARLNALVRNMPYEKMGREERRLAEALEAAAKNGSLTGGYADSLRRRVLTDEERAHVRAFYEHLATMNVEDVRSAADRERLRFVQDRLRAMKSDGTFEHYVTQY